MTTLPFPVVCECGYNTMDTTKAHEHVINQHLNTEEALELLTLEGYLRWAEGKPLRLEHMKGEE